MLHGYFITGTDTGVGKTVASAALMHRLRPSGTVCYWKPIQTGVEQDDDTAIVRSLGACRDDEILDDGVRLVGPFSPHLSARLAGVQLTIGSVMAIAQKARRSSCWIVEGAGGVLVPLNDRELMIDLMTRLNLPVVVVARTTLGTINHTLLTVEALQARGLEIAGVLMVGEPNRENAAAIEQHGRVRVIGEIAMLKPLTPESVRLAAQGCDVSCTGRKP